MSADSILRFGEFELDATAGELRRRGRKVKLAPQPFRLLALFATSPGVVLTRGVIRRQLWNDTFVDFEHGLNFCVREVRRALRDHATRPHFIETLPRRGYRFVAHVNRVEPNANSLWARQARPQPADAAAEYAEGRKHFGEMGTASLEMAARHFQRALDASPNYAMAHSGLGASYAMRYIRDANSENLRLAKHHLERACSLDAELAEPYPWLCYVHMRHGEVENAIENGRRAVELLPDLVQAQYFLGLAYFVSCESGAQNYNLAVHHLLEAAKVGPLWPATWFVLAFICLLNAEYAKTEDFAHRLLRCNALENATTKFVGAENLLGTIYLRRLDLRAARQYFQRSLEVLAASDHTYANSMRTWSACGLGDIALREGLPEAALAHYRGAWQMVQEFPKMMAHERYGARALAGLAAAYGALHQFDRAEKLLAQGAPLLQRSQQIQTSAAGASLAELQYAFGVAYLRIGNQENSLAHLVCALNAGWRDADWFERDPELRTLRAHSAFTSLAQQIRRSSAVFATDVRGYDL
jgi:DNA-binding winged helix-turn-helix (wHTH) protein